MNKKSVEQGARPKFGSEQAVKKDRVTFPEIRAHVLRENVKSMEVRVYRQDQKPFDATTDKRSKKREKPLESILRMSKIQQTPKPRPKKTSASNANLKNASSKGLPVKRNSNTFQELPSNERLFGGGPAASLKQSDKSVKPRDSDFKIKRSHAAAPERRLESSLPLHRQVSSSNSSVPNGSEDGPAGRFAKPKRGSLAGDSETLAAKSSSVPPHTFKASASREDLPGERAPAGGLGSFKIHRSEKMKWSKAAPRLAAPKEPQEQPWQRNRIAETDGSGAKAASQPGKPDDYLMDNLKHMIIEEADNMIDESDKENEFAEEREILVKLKKSRKKTNILADLIPLNMQEEKEKFYAKGCKYDPQFVYSNENLVLKYKKPHSQFVREARNILDAVLSMYGTDDNFFELQGQVVSREATGTIE